MAEPKIRNITKGLNPPQKEAVTRSYKNPTLVIAGAGSGKTRVLTQRIAYILAKGVNPRRLLAVTFTNKAAKEMKERVANVVGEEAGKKLLIGTFHSLAVRWLHEFHSEAGLKKNWTIFDTDDTDKLLKKAIKMHGMDDSKSSVYATKARISNLKNAMITPGKFAQTMSRGDKDFKNVYETYQDLLTRNNGVDFDDLIMKMVFLLESQPLIRAKFQKRFKYVMCDEYQDTNECQYRMIKAIVGTTNNIFVVGDDYQSIYGWRGADVQKILNFQKDYPNTKIIKLEQNYRSTKTIVEAGNHIMTNNTKQMSKICFSDDVVGEKIKLFRADDDEQEASFIADEIRNLTMFAGYNYEDIAILYRTNVQSRLLEDHFIRKQIPYNMVSGFSFYERREVRDILAWIQLSVNPDNDIACDRVLNMQAGVGKTTIKGFVDKQKRGQSLYDIVENSSPRTTKAAAAIAGMTHTVTRLNAIYEAGKTITDTPITDMFELIFKYTNYIEQLQEDGTEESSRRIDNLRELQKIAKGYEEETKNPNMQDFLDQVALQSKADKVQGTDEVQMMTLHTSKGLEYPVVFLIGLEEGLFPHKNSLQEANQLEEERRLAYVGITRAQKLLYVTMARRRMDWSRNYNFQTESRFINELPQHLLEEI